MKLCYSLIMILYRLHTLLKLRSKIKYNLLSLKNLHFSDNPNNNSKYKELINKPKQLLSKIIKGVNYNKD